MPQVVSISTFLKFSAFKDVVKVAFSYTNSFFESLYYNPKAEKSMGLASLIK